MSAIVSAGCTSYNSIAMARRRTKGSKIVFKTIHNTEKKEKKIDVLTLTHKNKQLQTAARQSSLLESLPEASLDLFREFHLSVESVYQNPLPLL